MPMRPVAKWRAREQDRGEFQSARIGKPGGFFGRLDRFCFDHGVLARMALARLAVPRAGGGADRLLRAGSLRQRGRHLAAKSASAGRRGRARRFRFLCSGALLGPRAFARRPRRRARNQCDTGANLGFVVHGLWPQYEHGFPSDCGPAARFPSRIALESARGLYPSEGLARHEWQKHGTCSGKSPTDYFADVRRARDSVVIPSPFAAPKEQKTWTPVDIARAFIAANPRLRPGMLGVACTGSVLQEVRICFSKDLRDFHACPEVSRQGCRVRGVSVPPVL